MLGFEIPGKYWTGRVLIKLFWVSYETTLLSPIHFSFTRCLVRSFFVNSLFLYNFTNFLDSYFLKFSGTFVRSTTKIVSGFLRVGYFWHCPDRSLSNYERSFHESKVNLFLDQTLFTSKVCAQTKIVCCFVPKKMAWEEIFFKSAFFNKVLGHKCQEVNNPLKMF